MPLQQLPDPILLCIVFESDVATLKHLRLACRSFNALMEAYGKSIHDKALAKAYTQDLADCFDIRWRESSHLTALFVADGRIQEARWMAAVRLRASRNVWPRRRSFHDHYEIYDIMSMWESVVMGLGIMWRLHDCATREIYFDFGHDVLRSAAYMSDITVDYPRLKDLENRILRKQIRFVENLTMAHVDSLYYALGFCVRVLYFGREFKPHSHSKDIDYQIKHKWPKWLALREGPAFAAKAWRSEAVKQMHSELIWRHLTNRSRAQIDIEMGAAELLYEAVKQQAIELRGGFCPSPPGSPCIIASEGGLAELEHWSGMQGLADSGWHLALGHEHFVIVIPVPSEPDSS